MTDDNQPLFLDTNIILRANIASAPIHNEALRAIQKFRSLKTELWISRQIIREYLVNVTRTQTFMNALSPAQAAERARYLKTHFRVADETDSVTDKLLELMENVQFGGKQVHDANIVATMLTYGIPRLLTLNIADFARFADYITVLSLEDVNDKEEAQE